MTERIKSLLPAIILGLIVLGLAVWYTVSVPAPVQAPLVPVAATEPAQIAEEATYYAVDATYPTQTPLLATAGVKADTEAVGAMKTFVEQEIARFKDNGNFANLTHDDVQMLGLDQRKYALGIEYKTHVGAGTISYVYQMYADTGGAHPNTYYRTFTFDSKTGEEVEIEDAFIPGTDYLNLLSTKSRALLVPLIAGRESVSVSEVQTDQIDSGTLPEVDSFQNFYFEGSSLVLIFPPYQVGPYVLGMIELPIPASALPGLRPEYVK